MKRLVGVAGISLALAGCGSAAVSTTASGGGAPGPGSPAAAVDPASHERITDQAVAGLLAAMAVPPGARPASSDEASHIDVPEYTMSPNLVDRHATYVVPMTMDAVIAWYDGRPPPGTESAGSGQSGDRAGVTSRSLMFDGTGHDPAYDGLEADVVAQPRADGGALVRLDAQAVWLPDAAPARVPDGATSVDVLRVTDSGAVRRATLRGRAVRRLTDLVNRQHAVSPGLGSCGNDQGAHDVLTFHGPWPNHRYAAELACGTSGVRVGGQPLGMSITGALAVDHLVTELLSSRR